MTLRDLYSKVFRPWPPIHDPATLADFIDEQAAFLAQKGIYEYARARAGHYAKVLFKEQDFIDAVERSRWQAYPLGLVMLAELVEGILAARIDTDRGQTLRIVRDLTLAVFGRYPVPEVLGAQLWGDARTELARRLQLIGTHPPKRAMHIPEPFAEAYFELMPIHKKLRASDFQTLHNYLRVTLCNMHDELSRRLDAPRLGKSVVEQRFGASDASR
jgi:hypothetical protein